MSLFKTCCLIGSGLLGFGYWLSRQKSYTGPTVYQGQQTYILAHRGGADLAPESTTAAFDIAYALNVDGFEIDIHLTKDNHIVVMHDDIIDHVTPYKGFVSDYTLSQLQQMDFGYHFMDNQGQFPYRNKGLTILTLEQLLLKYPNVTINMDIKPHPKSEKGQIFPTLLYQLLMKLNVQHRVLVTSFYQQQIENFYQLSQGQFAVGAGVLEVAKGYILSVLHLGKYYQPHCLTYQIPTQQYGINLTHPKFINLLRQKQLIVGYWTINTADEMQALVRQGANMIVTDRPDIAVALRNNKKI